MNKSIRRIFSVALSAAIFLCSMCLVSPQLEADALSAPMDSIIRLSGSSRIDTACAVADKVKVLTGSTNSVVLANGTNYADALAGVPFAVANKAPILLTSASASGTKLEDMNLKKIQSLGARTVYILGGTSAVSAAVESQLKGAGYTVTRIAGSNRYESAVRVSERLALKEKTVFIVSGENFPDALSAAPVAGMLGAAVLYCNSSGNLDAATVSYIRNAGIQTAYIIGGAYAINPAVETQLKGIGVSKVERIAGTSRYDTSYQVYMRFKAKFSANTVCFATGADFPDALAGSVYAALQKSPLFLLSYNTKNDEAFKYLNAYNLNKVTVFGGNYAVSQLTLGYLYDDNFDRSFEIGINGATGYALKTMTIAGTSAKIPAGGAFRIIAESGSNLTVKYNGVQGSIPSKYCLINLPDVLPGIIYKISNASGSVYRSGSYTLDGITGQNIYGISKQYNTRLQKNEYIVPVLFTAAKKIAAAEKAAFKDGSVLMIYDAFRPFSVTQKITGVFSKMVSAGKCGNLTKYGFNSSWFLATKLSTHNVGAAIDVTLADAVTGTERQMPTAMHELSTAAAKYQGSGSKTYTPTMNDNAKKLHGYFSAAGMDAIESEWWHFEVRSDYDAVKGSREISNNWYPTKLAE